MDFGPASGEEDGWGTFTCAEGAAIVKAGEGVEGRESTADTAALGESLCCCESEESPPESFFDDVAALVAGSWARGVLTDAFPGCWEAGLFFIEAALFSAADIVCKFVAAGVMGTLFELP